MIHARTGERGIRTEFALLYRVTTLRLELYACVHSLRHRLYLLLKTAPPPPFFTRPPLPRIWR
jgi:hypothetical protein